VVQKVSPQVSVIFASNRPTDRFQLASKQRTAVIIYKVMITISLHLTIPCQILLPALIKTYIKLGDIL